MMNTEKTSCFKQISLRTLVFVFFVHSLLILINILISLPSKSSFKINHSMMKKTDFENKLRNFMNYERFTTINGAMDRSVVLTPSNGEENISDNGSKLSADKEIVVNEIDITINETNTGTVNLDVRRDHLGTVQYDILGNPMLEGAEGFPRQDTCNQCFSNNFKYSIDNPGICRQKQNQPEIELLILIFTIHANKIQRETIRKTWLLISKSNTANVRYAFLLGEIQDEKLKEEVLRESKQYGDILKENFIDSYTNLTYKTIMGLQWASTKCHIAKAIMKTDDDMYVNVPNVLRIVRKHGELLQTNIVGSCSQQASPIRSQGSKWYASVKSFPGKFYPGFCSGTGYVTSINVARKVYEISPHVPFFHLEDVYVSLCIKRIGYHLKGFPGFNRTRPKLDPCLFKGKKLITAHKMAPAMIKQMWDSDCPSNRKDHKMKMATSNKQ